MKTTIKREFVNLAGIDERIPQADGGVSIISNMAVDPRTSGWDSRIGYEKFFSGASVYGLPFNGHRGVHSLYVWSTHNGARQYYVYEIEDSSGDCHLRFLDIPNNRDSTIDSGRTVPTRSQPLTDYEPYGRWLIVTNGHEQPIRFDSSTRQAQALGWYSTPSAPHPWTPDSDATQGAGLTNGLVLSWPISPTVRTTGLGSTTDDAENTYRWKVSFVNELGSESPVSPQSAEATWVTLAGGSYTNLKEASENKRHAVYLENIPRGPAGTVARRLYRTRNLGESDNTSAVFYFVTVIHNNTDTVYVDYTPDDLLGTEAPSNADSILMPAPGARFSATFQGRLFLDGGSADSNKLYYSEPGAPDTFKALSFFDLGSREGGCITGLITYYTELIVFRERAVDVVRQTGAGFSISPLVQGVGTRAQSSITVVAGLGIFFLSDDGVYLLKGGLVGGSQMSFSNVSAPILRTIKRLNPDVIERAVAIYSPKWKEWHCYFSVDGADVPNLGIVYHLEKDAWSIREGFPVGCLALDRGGNILFGHNEGDQRVTPVMGGDYEAGIFAISRKPHRGHIISLTAPGFQDIGTEITEDGPATTWKFKSKWHDFGYPSQKKFIKYVYLYVMTKGDNSIPMAVFEDYSSIGTDIDSEKSQRAEYEDQPVYGTATWDTSTWQEELVTEIRYPIPQKAVSHFAFQIETTNDVVLLGYSVELTSNEMRTGRGKI